MLLRSGLPDVGVCGPISGGVRGV